MTRVGVSGAVGRMGRTVCAAVVGDPDLELVAAVDVGGAGSVEGLTVQPDTQAFVDADCDVVVDFTVAAAARSTLRVLAAAGVHAVVGTSGLGDDDLDDLRARFTSSNCLVVPNFAIGAVLMMRFAEMASPFFETAEIIELHHDRKVDAPSGTAIQTADRMAAASGDWAADPTEREVLAGARGAQGSGGIPVHAVRLRGIVAHQEVLLGTEGQTLSIRHDSYDRSSFMPGVLLAVKGVADLPGVTIGLDALLGL